MHSILALLVLGSPQTEALDRLEAYLAKATSLRVEVTLKSPGYEGQGKGTLIWRRPKEQAFSVTWGPGAAAFRQSPSGVIEINKTAKTYRTFAPPPYLAQPPSEVSALTGLTYPSVLLSGGLRKDLPPEMKYTAAEPETIGGQKADVVKGTFRGQVDIDVEAAIAPDGRLLRYRTKTTSPEMNREIEWVFTEWDLNPTIAPGTFSFSVDNGYTPFSLPDQPWPVEVGAKAPLGSWSDIKSSAKTDVKSWSKGRWLLLGFVDNEIASLALRKAWRALRSDLGKQKPLDAMVSMAAIPEATRTFKMTPELTSTWRVPGYPFIALVNPSGEIVWLMFGFAADQEKAIRESMRFAVEGGL